MNHRLTPISGVTLLELLIVMTIIGIMVCLLLPAIQYSREMSRRVQCQSNLHQLGIAATTYVEFYRTFPAPCPADRIGGWAIAVLPYCEESSLGEELAGFPPLTSQVHRTIARTRPAILTCPSAFDGESNEPPMAVAHYAGSFIKAKRVEASHWGISDVPLDSEPAWATSPGFDRFQWAPKKDARGPHSGGFNRLSGTGRNAQEVTFEN